MAWCAAARERASSSSRSPSDPGLEGANAAKVARFTLWMWSKRMRQNMLVVFTICMFVNVGMWLERFVIIVTSLHRDFLPSSWEMYYPTIWDFMTLAGTIGLFTTLMFLFVRLLPMISIFEVRALLPEANPKPPASGESH